MSCTCPLFMNTTGQLPCAFLSNCSFSLPIWESLTQSGRQNLRSKFTEEDRVLGLENHREHRPVSFQVWVQCPTEVSQFDHPHLASPFPPSSQPLSKFLPRKPQRKNKSIENKANCLFHKKPFPSAQGLDVKALGIGWVGHLC